MCIRDRLKSGSGVDTVLISESMAPAVAAYYTALAKEMCIRDSIKRDSVSSGERTRKRANRE